MVRLDKYWCRAVLSLHCTDKVGLGPALRAGGDMISAQIDQNWPRAVEGKGCAAQCIYYTMGMVV